MELHLIDGLLGRTLTILALSLLLSPIAARLFGLPNWTRWQGFLALGAGWLAAAILLNVIVQSASDSSQNLSSLWRPELVQFRRWLKPALLNTQVGHWWIVQASVLAGLTALSGVRLKAKASELLTVVLAFTWLWSFVRMGHGGSYPLRSPWPWLQFIHNASVVFWVASLFALVAHLFSSSLDRGRLKKFSHTMIVTMAVILLTGLLRAWPVVFVREPEPSGQAYTWLLYAKISVVLIVLAVAGSMRRQIFSKTFNRAKWQGWLSFEMFWAGILLCLSALLSQLPPP